LSAVPAGESKAFVAELVARHGGRLRRFLAARLRNTADIGDLAQEVYLRLLRVEHHDHIRNPEAYLLTIAGHVLQQHALASAALPVTVDTMDELIDERIADESDPVASLHLERRLAVLDKALSRLPPKARAAFILQRRDGCTVDEIAVRLGISRSMVKKYLAKAILQCNRQIRSEGGSRP
jgi:RNA polymerase sigma factor (sigma-70 family)